MIDALVFDFDGVIVDTETPEYDSWAEVFHSHGVELDRSLWVTFIGTTLGGFDVLGHLEGLAGCRLDREAVRRERRRRHLAAVDANPILPGVLDYIDDAKRLGLKLGVASSSPRWWVERNLTKRGLLDHFDSIMSSDDVAEVKPDPELYLASVEHLGTRPERAVAIEDSAHGATAAKEAGLLCVAVPGPMTRELSIDRADIRMEALSDMPLRDLITRLDRTAATR